MPTRQKRRWPRSPQPELFDGRSPPLTGSHTIDFDEIAAIASELLGHVCTRETVSDDSYRTGLIDHGLPPFMVDALGTLYKASRANEFAVVNPTLERLLNREPTPMKHVLAGFFRETTGPLPMDRVRPPETT